MSSSDRGAKRIARLLDALIADYPRRKREYERAFTDLGLPCASELHVGPPEQVAKLPTFDRKKTRPVTPMLAGRYAYAGVWQMDVDVWLPPSGMGPEMQKRVVRRIHDSLREHWEGSAPMAYPDDRLTLFGVTDGVPDALTYLVWRQDGHEPEVWAYSGQYDHKFRHLEEFIRWQLERE